MIPIVEPFKMKGVRSNGDMTVYESVHGVLYTSLSHIYDQMKPIIDEIKTIIGGSSTSGEKIVEIMFLSLKFPFVFTQFGFLPPSVFFLFFYIFFPYF